MFKTLRDAFKVKEIRMGLLFTFFVLIVIRFDPKKGFLQCFQDKGGSHPFWFVDPGTGIEYSRNQGIFGERAR